MDDTMKKLQAPFPPEDIEWRVQSCGISNNKPWALVLAYVQARAIQRRLDDVFGWDGWADEYRAVGNNMICRLGVKSDNGWIHKENGASETDIEAFKGGISGAFKRVAASGFGIGRYLYSLTEAYAECSLQKPNDMTGWEKAKTKDKTVVYWKIPQLPAWALPEGYRYPQQPPRQPSQTASSAPPKADNSRTLCADCDKPLSVKEIAWCNDHADKFKGKLLCQGCQKKPDYK